MEPGSLLVLACYLAPTLLAGLIASILALQTLKAWKAFLTALLGTIILAAALGALANRLPMWGMWSPTPYPWVYHLLISPVLGLPLGALCAAWVASRPPPSIRQ